jgi:hypothetical protein
VSEEQLISFGAKIVSDFSFSKNVADDVADACSVPFDRMNHQSIILHHRILHPPFSTLSITHAVFNRVFGHYKLHPKLQE